MQKSVPLGYILQRNLTTEALFSDMILWIWIGSKNYLKVPLCSTECPLRYKVLVRCDGAEGAGEMLTLMNSTGAFFPNLKFLMTLARFPCLHCRPCPNYEVLVNAKSLERDMKEIKENIRRGFERVHPDRLCGP